MLLFLLPYRSLIFFVFSRLEKIFHPFIFTGEIYFNSIKHIIKLVHSCFDKTFEIDAFSSHFLATLWGGKNLGFNDQIFCKWLNFLPAIFNPIVFCQTKVFTHFFFNPSNIFTRLFWLKKIAKFRPEDNSDSSSIKYFCVLFYFFFLFYSFLYPKFSENIAFLTHDTHTCMWVSGVRHVTFLENFSYKLNDFFQT